MTRIQRTWQNSFAISMKSVFVTVLLLACCSVVIKAQSCLTEDDVKQTLARIDTPPPPAPNKKLEEDLITMAIKQRELLLQVVENDQRKQSDQEKLHKTYEDHVVKLCQIIKTNGWPTTALVEQDGVFAAFQILKNAATFDLQRDLLPVIAAVIK